MATRIKNGILIVIIVLTVLVTNLSSANFVCGTVNTSGQLTPQWQTVKVYNPLMPSKISTCQVSPAGNKYCCDTEIIFGENWKSGETIYSKIVDTKTGYATNLAQIQTTGAGFDIMPELIMEKVIKFQNNTKIFLKNQSNHEIQATFKSSYNKIDLKINEENKTNICENCTSIKEEITLKFGTNNLDIFASDTEDVFKETKKITILQNVSIQRNLICEKCKENKIMSGSSVTIELNLKPSHKIENLELKEFVPIDFEIISTNAQIKNYSETHKVLIWNVTGEDIKVDYEISSPKTLFIPKRYNFKTELEDLEIDNSQIILYRFFSFLAKNKEMISSNQNFSHLFKTSSTKPLIIRNQEIFKRIVVFTNTEEKLVNFEIKFLNSTLDLENIIYAYEFQTTLNPEEIKETLLEFEIDKKSLEKISKEDLKFYSLKNNWTEITPEITKENPSKISYSITIDDSKAFAITQNKKGFFRNLFG